MLNYICYNSICWDLINCEVMIKLFMSPICVIYDLACSSMLVVTFSKRVLRSPRESFVLDGRFMPPPCLGMSDRNV